MSSLTVTSIGIWLDSGIDLERKHGIDLLSEKCKPDNYYLITTKKIILECKKLHLDQEKYNYFAINDLNLLPIQRLNTNGITFYKALKAQGIILLNYEDILRNIKQNYKNNKTFKEVLDFMQNIKSFKSSLCIQLKTHILKLLSPYYTLFTGNYVLYTDLTVKHNGAIFRNVFNMNDKVRIKLCLTMVSKEDLFYKTLVSGGVAMDEFKENINEIIIDEKIVLFTRKSEDVLIMFVEFLRKWNLEYEYDNYYFSNTSSNKHSTRHTVFDLMSGVYSPGTLFSRTRVSHTNPLLLPRKLRAIYIELQYIFDELSIAHYIKKK